MLLSIRQIFCQFYPGVAYNSGAYKKVCSCQKDIFLSKLHCHFCYQEYQSLARLAQLSSLAFLLLRITHLISRTVNTLKQKKTHIFLNFSHSKTAQSTLKLHGNTHPTKLSIKAIVVSCAGNISTIVLINPAKLTTF